jgi:DNA-binding MarR family transcriptional regulator
MAAFSGAAMSQTAHNEETENTRIVLSLLESVERDGAQSQRKLAADLGIALGLVNAYLKRCVTKGLLKIGEVPTRRYAYYLTPHGFAEKSRLTVEYLVSSFSFFRRARADCSDVLNKARSRGWQRIALLGVSDLAEVATICALESGITITAIIDPHSTLDRYVGVPVLTSMDAVTETDAVMVTDLQNTQETVTAAVKKFGAHGVLVPLLLGIKPVDDKDMVA